MKDILVGSVKSKTQWTAFVMVVLGVVLDNQELAQQLIPAEYFGKVLAAFGLISMILRGVTNTSLAEKAAPKEGGFVRLGFFPLLIVLSLAAGCETFQAATQPLPRAESSEPAPVKAARLAIDEANAALIGLNVVIGDNVAAKVWTPDQAQTYLDESKAAGGKLDRAREVLRAGLPLDARSQAEAVRALVIALHRQVAAAARKEN